MFSRGIHISAVLERQGISSIYVYGFGEMGQIVIGDLLESKIIVAGVMDRNAKGDSLYFTYGDKTHKIPIANIISNDDIPILVTPVNHFDEIAESLIDKGIQPSRLYSLDIVLRWGCSLIDGFCEDGYIGKYANKEFLITGTGFFNKGSQAMCFAMVDEIRRRYENAQIWVQGWFLNNEDWKKANRTFKLFFLPPDESLMSSVMPHLSAVFDISGYALGSNWSNDVIWSFKRRVGIAEKYDVPIYLMPQSFGPFEFDREGREGLQELLSGVTSIFAREEEGYKQLLDKYSLSNVIKSEDMVLQHKDINVENIYREYLKKNYILSTDDNVAIVPNLQNGKHADKNEVVELYRAAVDLLIKMKKNVFVINHSEDDDVCLEIMEPFWNEGSVHLYGKKFDCLGFEELIKNFQFVVASRYHSVVHSYRQGVPCIVLGWADKYRELADTFGQKDYVFDVRKTNSRGEFFEGIKTLSECWREEKKKIESVFGDIQKKKNCFDYITW